MINESPICDSNHLQNNFADKNTQYLDEILRINNQKNQFLDEILPSDNQNIETNPIKEEGLDKLMTNINKQSIKSGQN